MKRTVLIAAALFSVIVFGFLAWNARQVGHPPDGIVLHEDGSIAKVPAFASYNMWGEDGNGNGQKEYTLIEPIAEYHQQWLTLHKFSRTGFEPDREVGCADSLCLYPLFFGHVRFDKTE